MVILPSPLASTSVVGSFVIVDAMRGGDVCSLFALKRPCLSSASKVISLELVFPNDLVFQCLCDFMLADNQEKT